eukprot:scaffold2849_cov203-Alexandrium_tamarense.AAC.16
MEYLVIRFLWSVALALLLGGRSTLVDAYQSPVVVWVSNDVSVVSSRVAQTRVYPIIILAIPATTPFNSKSISHSPNVTTSLSSPPNTTVSLLHFSTPPLYQLNFSTAKLMEYFF